MKSLKALFGVFVVAALMYIGFKVMPPYFANYQFQDEIQNATETNSYNQKSDQEIKEGVVSKARELHIAITSEQVRVERSGPELSISADYTVHIDIPVYPFDLHFTPSGKNKRI